MALCIDISKHALTAAMLLLVLGILPCLIAEDVPSPTIPNWVIAGIAAVETGSVYREGELVLYRDRRDGAAGEVGPWQLSPAALTDMGISRLRNRIRHEPLLAESMARAWLLHCYSRCRNWMDAVALYHVGLRRSTSAGFPYAHRVFAAGSSL